jgi:hypothetical protein
VEVTDFDELKRIGLHYIAFERKKRLDAFYGFLGNSIQPRHERYRSYRSYRRYIERHGFNWTSGKAVKRIIWKKNITQRR